MIKLLTIIGARPQIIKASAISRAIRTHFADSVVDKILHTGQHYDTNMSQVFFEERYLRPIITSTWVRRVMENKPPK